MTKPSSSAVILCRELSLADGNAPEWIHVLPLGPDIQGRDGRKFRMDDPEAVAALMDSDIRIDEDHESEGWGSTKARGWVTSLKVVANADETYAQPGIWAQVDWTPKGAETVKAREYRYLSPAFNYWMDEAGTVHIAKLSSVALTNRPNLDLTALNRSSTSDDEPEKTTMEKEQRIALCSALGLAPEVSADVIVQHAKALKDGAGKVPEGWVPRADLEVALNRANAAEAELKSAREKSRAVEVNSLIDEAVKAGKVAPASREQYAALCSTDAGFEGVKALFASLPSLGLDKPQGSAGAPPSKNGDVSLNEEDRAVMKRLNITEAEYIASKRELSAPQEG